MTGFWNLTREKLAGGLAKSRQGLWARLSGVLGTRRLIDAETLEAFEAALLSADCGPKATQAILKDLAERFRGREAARDDMQAALREIVASRLPRAPEVAWAASGPTVVLVVGTNGTGKTTTVGKLAWRYRAAGRKVLVAAADTFRAAAVEQLAVWCARSGVPCIRAAAGGDPAALVFDAAQAAVSRGVDLLLVDTAGRLHTYGHLMRELEKVARVAGKAIPGAPHEALLVLDATTGQNALAQAQAFRGIVKLTGVILAKMDGTAKGGVVLAIQDELSLPVRFVGVGESPEDLADFDPAAYAEGLL